MDTAPTEPSRITILQAPGRRPTKSYDQDRNGKVTKRADDSAKMLHARVHEFIGVDGLADLLRWLQRHSDCCVIRGLPGRYFPQDGKPIQRRLHAAAELADARGKFHKPATS